MQRVEGRRLQRMGLQLAARLARVDADDHPALLLPAWQGGHVPGEGEGEGECEGECEGEGEGGG